MRAAFGSVAARRRTIASIAGLLGVGLFVLWISEMGALAPARILGRGAAGGTLLFVVCGWTAAARLTPEPLRRVWPILALPAGAVLSGVGLTVLGFAAVPLEVSVWVVLALGVAAHLRWGRGRTPPVDWWATAPWIVAGLVVFMVATLPARRLNTVTVYGQNPDAHQVVGAAELFAHAPGWATREELPVDVVPSAWRFRYPIMYVLAGASHLAWFDPIRVFPAISGLAVVLAALGFGALAVLCLRAPPGSGPWIALIAGCNPLVLHMAWHPYYNQLWGMALLPWTIALGWWAVRARSRTAAAGFAGTLTMLVLAYPMAVLYPVVVVGGMLWAHRVERPRIARPRAVWHWLALGVLGVVLVMPLLGAAGKIVAIGGQLLDPTASLWGGDIFGFVPVWEFVGAYSLVGLALVLAAAVAAAAKVLERREAMVWAGLLVICVVLDVRLRLSDRGQYMDFKHLAYTGALVVVFAMAGATVLWLSRRRVVRAVVAVIGTLWFLGVLAGARSETLLAQEQVTGDMFLLREWAAELPADATIRVDVPPSGVQLWAQYMLADLRVGSPYPVTKTTYAHMPVSYGGDYVLTTRYVPASDGSARPWPRPEHASEVVLESRSFLLRRLDVPAGERVDRSSLRMIQP